MIVLVTAPCTEYVPSLVSVEDSTTSASPDFFNVTVSVPTVPVEDHWMLYEVPRVHCVPPVGDTTAKLGAASMVKELVEPVTVPSVVSVAVMV